ncbi:MAG: BON domain-containing protein [Burkholderiaceae bacterium]
MRRRRPALLLLAALALPARAEERLRNWFDDPFFPIAAALPDCPEPAGPRTSEAEKRQQTHHRAERGTSCWLAGQCARPNSYAYDADIAQALKAALARRGPITEASLWVTVQGRIVFLEGCARRPALGSELEALARALPDVQQVIVDVYPGPPARPGYRLVDPLKPLGH